MVDMCNNAEIPNILHKAAKIGAGSTKKHDYVINEM
jgi:hypothetical protein